MKQIIILSILAMLFSCSQEDAPAPQYQPVEENEVEQESERSVSWSSGSRGTSSGSYYSSCFSSMLLGTYEARYEDDSKIIFYQFFFNNRYAQHVIEVLENGESVSMSISGEYERDKENGTITFYPSEGCLEEEYTRGFEFHSDYIIVETMDEMVEFERSQELINDYLEESIEDFCTEEL